MKTHFFHSQGCLSGNLSRNIPELVTSWCSNSRTVRTNSFVDHGGFLLRAAIYWSCSSLRTPAVRYTIKWWPFTSIWIYLHPTACYCLLMLLPVLRTILKCASWVLFLVAALAALQWTDWCLCSCCGPMYDVFDGAPVNQLELDPLGPGWGGFALMICWFGSGEEDDNEKEWEVLRTI